MMFYLNMENYPVFFLLLSTWTWDTFPTLRGTWGFYLNHVLPPRSSKSYGVVGWVAHKILVTAQRLNSSFPFGLGLVNNTNLISLRRFTEMRDHISQQFIILDQARLLSVPKVFCCGCVLILLLSSPVITENLKIWPDLASLAAHVFSLTLCIIFFSIQPSTLLHKVF